MIGGLTILLAYFKLVAAVVYLKKGTSTMSPKNICASYGLSNVMATSQTLQILTHCLKNNGKTTAYVCGWDGIRSDMVVHSNGAVAPYNAITNPTCYAFCTNSKVQNEVCNQDVCLIGKKVEVKPAKPYVDICNGYPQKEVNVCFDVCKENNAQHVAQEACNIIQCPVSYKKKSVVISCEPKKPHKKTCLFCCIPVQRIYKLPKNWYEYKRCYYVIEIDCADDCREKRLLVDKCKQTTERIPKPIYCPKLLCQIYICLRQNSKCKEICLYTNKEGCLYARVGSRLYYIKNYNGGTDKMQNKMRLSLVNINKQEYCKLVEQGLYGITFQR